MTTGNGFRRFGISVAAAAAGTIVAIFTTGLLFAFHSVGSANARYAEGEAIGGVIYAALFIPWYMLPVWLFVLLPLCLFVPATAVVCRPSFAAACGAFAAVVAVAAVSILPGARMPTAFYVLAAVTAASSFYTGAALIRRTPPRPNHLTGRCSEPLAPPRSHFQ
jgi:uncharacterized membrane protein YhaH (DUF805 family)